MIRFATHNCVTWHDLQHTRTASLVGVIAGTAQFNYGLGVDFTKDFFNLFQSIKMIFYPNCNALIAANVSTWHHSTAIAARHCSDIVAGDGITVKYLFKLFDSLVRQAVQYRVTRRCSSFNE